MRKLKAAMRGVTTYEAAMRTRDSDGRVRVGHLQFKRLLDGQTKPWDVKVSTAQAICRAFPGKVKIQDFFRPRV